MNISPFCHGCGAILTAKQIKWIGYRKKNPWGYCSPPCQYLFITKYFGATPELKRAEINKARRKRYRERWAAMTKEEKREFLAKQKYQRYLRMEKKNGNAGRA